MDVLHYDATDNSPLITLDPDAEALIIRGESYPENTYEFYSPVMEWMRQYLEGRTEAVVLNIELEYFNSSSSKVLMDLFDLLDEAAENCPITVNWIAHEENDVVIEHGEEFAEDLEQITFNIEEISD